MIFHPSVSAGKARNPFTAHPPIYFTGKPDSSKFISFNSVVAKKKVSLNWIVTDNQDIDQFEVERSVDGKTFVLVALIFGTDKAGIDNYYFIEKLKKSKTYYRVKTIAKNGTITYSRAILAGTN
jgi:hypothetical protein